MAKKTKRQLAAEVIGRAEGAGQLPDAAAPVYTCYHCGRSQPVAAGTHCDACGHRNDRPRGECNCNACLAAYRPEPEPAGAVAGETWEREVNADVMEARARYLQKLQRLFRRVEHARESVAQARSCLADARGELERAELQLNLALAGVPTQDVMFSEHHFPERPPTLTGA